jgi:hypothetical protein
MLPSCVGFRPCLPFGTELAVGYLAPTGTWHQGTTSGPPRRHRSASQRCSPLYLGTTCGISTSPTTERTTLLCRCHTLLSLPALNVLQRRLRLQQAPSPLRPLVLVTQSGLPHCGFQRLLATSEEDELLSRPQGLSLPLWPAMHLQLTVAASARCQLRQTRVSLERMSPLMVRPSHRRSL